MINNQSVSDSIYYSIRIHGPQLRISPHFTLTEMSCNDGEHVVLVHPELMNGLELVRAHLSSVIHINSGYRTVTHNASIGGVNDSRHLYGVAADIVARDYSPAEVYKVCHDLGFGGVGKYKSFTHVDVFGENRRWDNT